MLRILHTNDFHGMLDAAREEKLLALRQECDVYFDSGDAIKAGNLSVPIGPEEAWTRLADLRCTASVPGNRESHILQSAFAKKLEGHTHPIICANLRLKTGKRPLPSHLLLDAGGMTIGVVGVMVPMVTDRMATQAASAYLWDQPIPKAIEEAKALRDRVDCLIALTHIGLRNDRLLATECPLYDLILGGHSHDVLLEPERIGKTAICQTGSHGRFAGRYDWSKAGGLIKYELVPLGS